MKAITLVLLTVMFATAATGCSDKPAQEASVSVAVPVPVPTVTPTASPSATTDAPSWEIGEDIAGKTVLIDGKEVVIPDDVADSKRKMDAVAKEKLDAMDALEKQRLERFNDPDMKP